MDWIIMSIGMDLIRSLENMERVFPPTSLGWRWPARTGSTCWTYH